MPSRFPARILCGVDFSGQSAAALRLSAALARSCGAQVSAIFVTAPGAPAYFLPSGAGDIDRASRQAILRSKEALENLARRAAPDIAVDCLAVEGHAADEILAAARDLSADVIAIGADSRPVLTQFFMGSVAEEMLRRSPVPVLTVRAGAADWVGSQPIICPITDSAASHAALDRAARLAVCAGLKLLVIHVQEPGAEPLTQAACEWLAQTGAPPCEIEEITRSGRASDEIIKLAAERNAGLIVLGSEHKRVADRTVIGSTTDRVVRQAPCPVLAVAVEEAKQRVTPSQIREAAR
jgi:nucleotide-binding universal stress UspA family protein